jgi:hypothetical protein
MVTVYILNGKAAAAAAALGFHHGLWRDDSSRHVMLKHFVENYVAMG